MYVCMYIICTLHRKVHTIEQTSLIAIKENVRICSVLYSVKSLKKEFVLRLPDKLRSGDLDPESETFGLDHSIEETSLIAI